MHQTTVLAIAYHNMGIEEEFLGNLDKALNWYEKSVSVLIDNQIPNDALLKKFSHAHEVAKNVRELFNLHDVRYFLRN